VGRVDLTQPWKNVVQVEPVLAFEDSDPFRSELVWVSADAPAAP
jgi:hypothetical protein